MSVITSNHDGSTDYKVIAGDDNTEWGVDIVDTSGRKAECIVHYPDQNKSQVVRIDQSNENDHNCTGTYFEYNKTCPHAQAAKIALAKHKSQSRTVDVDDPVHCEICGGVHRGSCEEISTHTIW